MRKHLFEFTLMDMDISGVTRKAIEKDGLGKLRLINANVYGDDLELLFEMESSHDAPKHVDMQGKEKPGLKYGYACGIRFLKATKVLKKDEKFDEDNLKKVFDKCDVQVHCDCPAFYWQGMHQDDSANKTAKYKFQGTPGNHKWTLIHADKGGKTGQALCKHLFKCQEWTYEHIPEVLEKLSLKEELVDPEIQQGVLDRLREVEDDIWCKDVDVPTMVGLAYGNLLGTAAFNIVLNWIEENANPMDEYQDQEEYIDYLRSLIDQILATLPESTAEIIAKYLSK